MDVRAFLAFAEKQERGRFELWRGELVAMAAERVEHVRAKFAISRALATAIERDTGLKVDGYFGVTTIAHYLVVDLPKRMVPHYRREGEARMGLTILRAGTLALDPPGMTLELAECFA